MKKTKLREKPVLLVMILTFAVTGLNSGCASGGFQLTRSFAGWVNSQNVVLRVILYILTAVIFAVTLLIDLLINNTIDFWDGKVSAGTYNFSKDEETMLRFTKLCLEQNLNVPRFA